MSAATIQKELRPLLTDLQEATKAIISASEVVSERDDTEGMRSVLRALQRIRNVEVVIAHVTDRAVSP
jgi:hypothetical protein